MTSEISASPSALDRTSNRLAAIGLCAAFFLSGAAALIFETLWFRLAGLALGNSVWASSLVLSAFMGGLALGNGVAVRWGQLVARPLRLYAQLEMLVAGAGLALMFLLPALTPWLAPLFGVLAKHPWLVNTLRFLVALSLMAIPTTAMGATLPLLTRSLSRHDRMFGRVLGRLYGWNTLGGVTGALGGELYLVALLGQRATALFAALLNVLAASLALYLSSRSEGPTASVAADGGLPRPSVHGGFRLRLLMAAGLAGGILLTLEVVWLRFLMLFVYGTATAFALMLAVILLGIGAGGLLTSSWLGRAERAHRAAPYVALACALATVVAYAAFDPRRSGATYFLSDTVSIAWLALRLMLPTSLLSGMVFTLIGRALRDEFRFDGQVAGLLSLSNTLGATAGALCGGFVLLPALGVERSLFGAALAYVGVAWLAREAPAGRPAMPRGMIAATGLVTAALAAFPFGLMRGHFVRLSLSRYLGPGDRVVAFREGLTETSVCIATDWGTQPWSYRLITNGHSMAATGFYGKRYMKQYVYWALAVNPAIRKTLLISYGLGSTAKALTDTRALETIDVVDTSRDILALSSVVYPDPSANPLKDGRVRAHVEDGRFFLQTTSDRFDLITSEPPPPKGAGIASLYSREYFELVRSRLRAGGVVTYWLPVNQLTVFEAKAVAHAFCDAFSDCTLWTGSGFDWMLAGTRGRSAPASEQEFTSQWSDTVVGSQMRDVGFERPEQMGATFIADAATLVAWVGTTPPLSDDTPGLLTPGPPTRADEQAFRELMDADRARTRFAESEFVSRLWPPALRTRTLAFFEYQRMFNDDFEAVREHRVPDLAAVLTHSTLRTLPLLLLDSEPELARRAQRALAEGVQDANVSFYAGAGALTEREYSTAASSFGRAESQGAAQEGLFLYQALTLGLDGRRQQAREVLFRHRDDSAPAWVAQARRWLEQYLLDVPL